MSFQNEDKAGGIHPPYEWFYIERILSSAQSATISWDNLVSHISKASDFQEIQQMNFIILRNCDNIINQAGIISRYFYPAHNRDKQKNQRYQLRGNALKQSYKVDDSNILKNRAFRNHLEHFDENLDEFLSKPVAGNFYTSVVLLDISDLSSITHVLKAFVINQSMFISLGEQIDLFSVVNEIHRIEKLSMAFMKTGRLG